MFLVQYGGITIKCDTEREMQQAVDYCEKKRLASAAKHPKGPAQKALEDSGFGPIVETSNPWTFKLFFEFIEALGQPQKEALGLLVMKRKVSDEQMRKALKATNNQQLAGLLSGISKQAAGLGIAARDVFTIENESKSGEVTKTYAVAYKFLETATECNWPTQ
jgi:hypothetical protein